MAYIQLKKITSPVGIAAPWAKLTEPDSYLNGPKVFTVGLILDPEDEGVSDYIAELDKQSQDAFDNAIAGMHNELETAKGKKIADLKQSIESLRLHKPYQPEYDDAGETTGRYVVKYKKKAEGVYGPKHKKAGESWTATCTIFDGGKRPVDPSAGTIQGGSVLRVQCEVAPFSMPATQIAGISLRIFAVQVLEMVGGSESCDAFDVVEGGYRAPEVEAISADDSADF